MSLNSYPFIYQVFRFINIQQHFKIFRAYSYCQHKYFYFELLKYFFYLLQKELWYENTLQLMESLNIYMNFNIGYFGKIKLMYYLSVDCGLIAYKTNYTII